MGCLNERQFLTLSDFLSELELLLCTVVRLSGACRYGAPFRSFR